MDEGTGSEARKSQQHVSESVRALVPRAKGVTEGALLPKNCLVNLRPSVAATVDAVVLLKVMVECWDVGESLMNEHPAADSLSKLFDLFLDVGEECVRTPAPDQHDCVDRLLGEVHEHGEAGARGSGR